LCACLFIHWHHRLTDMQFPCQLVALSEIPGCILSQRPLDELFPFIVSGFEEICSVIRTQPTTRGNVNSASSIHNRRNATTMWQISQRSWGVSRQSGGGNREAGQVFIVRTAPASLDSVRFRQFSGKFVFN